MGQTQNLGIVAPVPKGSWTASQSYDRLNIVRHGNASYIAIVANIAVEPAVTQRWENSWMLLASDGSQTPSGANDYNLLENQPIFNVDLTTLATPVVNEYYRHIGATTNQFINDCIYRYNGTQFIILGDLDKAIADETYSNALKGNVGGTAIRIDDLTPFEDSVEVNVSGVSNPESVTISRYGKNLIPFPYAKMQHSEATVNYVAQEDGGIVVEGTPTGYSAMFIYSDGKLIAKSGKICVSLQGEYNSNILIGVTVQVKGGGEYLYTNDRETTQVLDMDSIIGNYNPNDLRMNISIKRARNNELMSGIVYPQIELGETATAYEKYIAPTTYAPNSNGNVEIPILRPTMSLLTNNVNANLSATYNRDINSAIYGTTETQPLATIDYVNTAIENNKYYQHSIVVFISNITTVITFAFSLISKTETKLITVSDSATMCKALISLLKNKYGVYNIPNLTGRVVEGSDGYGLGETSIINDSGTDKLQFMYGATGIASFSFDENGIACTLDETVIEIN